MKRRTKWILGGTGIGLVALATTGWFCAPAFIRWQINKKPGVHVDEVEILFKSECLRLKGVTVDRGWAKATLPEAVVCRDKTVQIDAGDVTVDLDARPEGKNPSQSTEGYVITAKNIAAHITKGDVQADVEGASYVNGNVTAESLKASHPKADAKASGITFEDGVVTVESATLTPKIQLLGHEVGEVELGETRFHLASRATHTTYVKTRFGRAESIDLTFEDSKALVHIGSVQVTENRVDPDPMTFRDIQVGPLDLTTPLQGDQAIQVNGLTLNFNIEDQHIWAKDSCQKWFDAVPQELHTGVLKGLQFTGDFRVDVRIKPTVKLDWDITCKSPKPAPDFIKALSKPFEYTVVDSKGKEVTRKTGPGTKEWVYYPNLSENLLTAITTTEDPVFFTHHGFIKQAIENSIIENVRTGKPARGGSTITMQLAKNLWLNRSKTLGRKVQEAFLTIVLESHLSKEKIVETYFNVVEFGPDVYGIGPGTRKYLHTSPDSLSLSEALYMTLRLPKPKSAGDFNSAKPMIKRVLTMLLNSGKVSSDLVGVEIDMLEDPVSDEPDLRP